MTNDDITRTALATGFKLKEQPDGTMALNPYVFDFARAIIDNELARVKALNDELMETLQGIVDANWRAWQELASPDEFVIWAKRRAAHAISKATGSQA